MISHDPNLEIRFAASKADRLGAQRLRYRVFVRELGANGPMVDHDVGLERDRFDDFFQHLILVDRRRDPAGLDHVVGVYRLLDSAAAARAGQFYSEDEYNLSPLKTSGRRLLELGRSCLDRDHRGGVALLMLWNGLADYVVQNNIEILFGVASFNGTNPHDLAMPLSYLHHRHLAPANLRIQVRTAQRTEMNQLPPSDIDRLAALRALPALIKAYLRIGGCVGDGAFVDHGFNTTDVCMVLDTAQMKPHLRGNAKSAVAT